MKKHMLYIMDLKNFRKPMAGHKLYSEGIMVKGGKAYAEDEGF